MSPSVELFSESHRRPLDRSVFSSCSVRAKKRRWASKSTLPSEQQLIACGSCSLQQRNRFRPSYIWPRWQNLVTFNADIEFDLNHTARWSASFIEGSAVAYRAHCTRSNNNIRATYTQRCRVQRTRLVARDRLAHGTFSGLINIRLRSRQTFGAFGFVAPTASTWVWLLQAPHGLAYRWYFGNMAPISKCWINRIDISRFYNIFLYFKLSISILSDSSALSYTTLKV